MAISKSNLGQVNIRDDSFPKDDRKNSRKSPFNRWTGISNISEAWKAHRKGNYSSALKSAGIGLTKLGTIAAACYGTYRWVVGHTVHINTFMTQAEKDFNSQSHQSFVPTSVVDLTEAFYAEQQTFSKWPKSGKAFFINHLASNAPMSSAIIKHLIETAEKKGDSTLKRPLIKECKKSSSASCVTVAESYTAEPHPDALSNAMSLLGQCRKSTNAFCNTVMENAKKQSLKAASLPDIVSLLRDIAKRPQDIQQNRDFAEKGISLFQPHVEQLQTAIDECQKAKPLLNARAWEKCPEWWRINYRSLGELIKQDDCIKEKYSEFEKFWTPCFSHAGFIQKLDGFDCGHSQWWQGRYLREKTDELTNTLENALSDQAVGLSEFCSQIFNSPICQNFIEQTFQKLVDANLSDDAMKLMMNSNGALNGKLSEVLEKLRKSGKWNEAIQFLLSFAKFNPKTDIKSQAQLLWSQVMQSNEAYLAFDLLSLKVSFDVVKTLEKAFQNKEENHLHRIYLVAKSWIQKKDAQYDPHLKFIIKELFAIHSSSYSYYDYIENEMAKVLVTKWMLSQDPNSILVMNFQSPSWSLQNKPDSSWDRYDSTITQNNWDQKLKSLQPGKKT